MNVPSGYTALDLVGFTDKGVYNSATNYVQNDLTHYGGNIWRCKADDTQGITPAEGAAWTLWIGEPTNLTEAIIAPLEVSPATAAHTVGDQLIYNDVLYKVIGAIAIGDTLTVGTNIEAARKIVYQISGIESDIATIEPTATASQNYAVGEYMFYGWEFYKVITAITAGDTIVTTGGSANVTEVTVGGELNALNNSLAQKVNKTVVSQQDVETLNTTAINNHSLDDLFLCSDGYYYRCTSAITGGSTTITVSNCEKTDISKELKRGTPRIRSVKQYYEFPTSNAGISGGNDSVTITDDGFAEVVYVFADEMYSQFSVFVNGQQVHPGRNITSGKVDLGGLTSTISFPVYKGDVVTVSFYSTYTMSKIRLSVLG